MNDTEKIIFLSTSKVQATFTVNATTDVITSTAHGLQGDECLQLTTATTLPAGLSLLTNYYVISRTVDTFQLALTPRGSAVDITDTGTGTHTFHLKGKAFNVGGFDSVALTLDFSGTPTMTVKIQGSIQDGVDFNAVQSANNRWDYLEVVDLEDGTAIDGDTGIACSGSADHRILEVNVTRMVWINVEVTAWTAGYLGATVRAS